MKQLIPSRRASLAGLSFLLMLLLSVVPSALAEGQAEQLRRPFWLQGQQMRKAFAQAVKDQRQRVVTLYSEDEEVALGAIVESDGWIVTKASQIQKATLCELSDGRRIPFEYVGFDINLDLALLKIDAKDLEPVDWQTEEPKVGEWLITTDSRELPVGGGVMSVSRREIPKSEARGVLGIQLEMVEEAIVEQVFPNSGAENAGLIPGDLIEEVGETVISGRRHLVETIATFRPGDTILLRIIREDKPLSISATLTHPFGGFLSRIAFQEQMGGPLSFRRDDFEAVYQHDTVLRPEECGGPVVTLAGKTVGINIARAGRTSTYVLPADLIVNRIEDLKTGKFPPPLAKQSDSAETSSDEPASDDSTGNVDSGNDNSDEE